MSRGQRTIASLLALIAVLLALNLMKGSATAAEGQEGPPTIVKLLLLNGASYVRVWSDGRVDHMQTLNSGVDFVVVYSYGPVEHPFPVVDATLSTRPDGAGVGVAVMLAYEDGRTDFLSSQDPRSTIAGVGSQSFCTADTDRNGFVDFNDLLTMFAQWGSCQ